MLEAAAASTNETALTKQATQAREHAEEALARLRQTVREIHPRELTDLGLTAAVEELAARSPLIIDVEVSGDDSGLSDPAAAAAYFTISEALANIAKHAGTDQAKVELRCDPEGVRLSVSNAGSGGASANKTGSGLAGLKERVSSVGGKLEITSPVGEGTTVFAAVPSEPPLVKRITHEHVGGSMKVVLADDAALIRAGIKEILTANGHEILRECSDATELTAVIDNLMDAGIPPDIVITDVRMPPGNTDDGLRAALELRSRYFDLPILMLSAYVVGPYVRELLSGPGTDGAVLYLLKENVGRVTDFLHAVDTVADGGVVIDPEVMKYAAKRDKQGGSLSRLTEREREVLILMAEGRSNTEISEHLALSSAAVSKHVSNIFLKLGFTPDQDNRHVKAILTWFEQN